MISLPVKFAVENARTECTPSFVVKVLNRDISNEQSTQSEWAANSAASNVDITSSSGDVLLSKTGDTWGARSAGFQRKNHSSAIWNGKIYLHGGAGPGSNVGTQDTYYYDIASDTWSGNLGNLDVRTGHTAVAYNGYMYVFHGSVNSDMWDIDSFYHTAAGRFNFDTNSWAYLPATPFKRMDGSAIVYNGKAYLFGGAYAGAGFNDIWEVDLATFAWVNKQANGTPVGPARRYAHTAVVWKNRMIVFGGNYANPDVNLDDCWELDLDTFVWTEKAKGPSIRLDHAATVRNGIMIIYGGTNGGVRKSDIWEFDIERNIWTQKTSDSTVRSHHVMQTHGDRAYALGGTDGSSVRNDVRQYEYHLYYQSGRIRTQTMDLTVVPTDPGEWTFSDVQPDGTSVIYEAWSSATGAFSGEETALGFVKDGDPIKDLKRYYRVSSVLYSDQTRLLTPVVQSVKADMGIYKNYSDTILTGYEASVMSVSTLSTTIDTFKPSTIGQVSVTFALTASISDFLATKYPKNKTVKILAGFIADGFTLNDYIDYFWGQIDDWKINNDRTITIDVKDFKKEWDAKVPKKWVSLADDVTWTAQHHVDVMLDILRNRINIRDSKILIDSFISLKAVLPGWKVTRKITGNPEAAKNLMEELRILVSGFFIPRPDGKVRIKRWDPGEAAIDALTDVNTQDISREGNGASLVNNYIHYYGWDGLGDDAKNFGAILDNYDPTSQSNWGEVAPKEIKDKWTKSTETSQITDLSNKVVARYANPPEIYSLKVSRNKIFLEPGDMVTLTTTHAPSSDLKGITNKKFQIIKRDLDFKSQWITLKLLAA